MDELRRKENPNPEISFEVHVDDDEEDQSQHNDSTVPLGQPLNESFNMASGKLIDTELASSDATKFKNAVPFSETDSKLQEDDDQNRLSATANSDIAKYAGEREASLEDGSEASSRRIENLRVVKIETVKFLQAIDSYLKQLEIKSDKEILLDNVVEIMSMRMSTEEATLAKTMLDLRDKSTTNEHISQVKANQNWKQFVTFCEHLNNLFRQLWIALRKPLYAPMPYELLLNSTLRTEIDVNFVHEDNMFYPNEYKKFLKSTEGKKLKRKVEKLMGMKENKSYSAGAQSSTKDKKLGGVSGSKTDGKQQDEDSKKALGKKRTLQDIEKPRKLWTSDILSLLTRNWGKDSQGYPVEDDDNFPENVSDMQLLKVLKMNYIACDELMDCSPEIKTSLIAQRRKRKLSLLDEMRQEKNSIFLKLMKDRMGGFQVEGFVPSPVTEMSEIGGNGSSK